MNNIGSPTTPTTPNKPPRPAQPGRPSRTAHEHWNHQAPRPTHTSAPSDDRPPRARHSTHPSCVIISRPTPPARRAKPSPIPESGIAFCRRRHRACVARRASTPTSRNDNVPFSFPSLLVPSPHRRNVTAPQPYPPAFSRPGALGACSLAWTLWPSPSDCLCVNSPDHLAVHDTLSSHSPAPRPFALQLVPR